MRWRSRLVGFVLLFVFVSVMGVALSNQMSGAPLMMMAFEPPAAPMIAQQSQELRYAAADGMLDVDDKQFTQDQTLVDGRIVLKNAVLRLVVDDVDAKMAQISALAGEYGGWIVNAQVQRTGSGDDSQVAYAVISIRVDAARLDQALEVIKDGANQVENESVTGQDVTQDYVDLSSQLTNLQAAERQLQEIMERATKTEDVLHVYNELVRVRGEIEVTQGRLRYYEEASATSSIQVTLSPTPTVQPVEIGGWRPQETARNAFQALINVLQGAADVAISVAIFAVPLAIFVGIPAWWVLRRRRALHASTAGTAS
jgi:hypothetical protein